MPRKATCRMCGRGFERRGRGAPVHCPECGKRAASESTKMLRAKCKECGNGFKTRSRAVRYCPERCKRAGYGRRHDHTPWRAPHDGTVECRECGRTFKAPSRVFRYCSEECRTRGYGRRYAVPPRPLGALSKAVKCRVCGRGFKTDRAPGTRRVYCSEPCSARGGLALALDANRRHNADPEKHAVNLARKSAYNARRRAEAARSRTGQCRECGKDFTPGQPGTKYCSQPCRKASRARRSAAYYRRRRERRGPRKARCLACSAEFAPGLVEGGLRHYCSFACRSDARRASGREYARQKRRLAASEAAGKSGGKGGSRRRRRRR